MNFRLPLKPFSENNNFFFTADGTEKIQVYTARSFLRENRILHDKLSQACSNGSLLIYVVPWHNNLIIELAEQKLNCLYTLTPFQFEPPGRETVKLFNIIQSDSGWEDFLFGLTGNEKFEIFIHPSLTKVADYKAEILNDIKNAAARIKTIRHLSNLWFYNAHRNRSLWQAGLPFHNYEKRDAVTIVTAGTSLDEWLIARDHDPAHIWCADTCLHPLLHNGIVPDLVFSIDPGYASMEHFSGIPQSILRNLNLLADPLSYPGIWELPCRQIFSYKSTNPLADNLPNIWTTLEKTGNDVTSTMKAACKHLGIPLASVIGHDGQHKNYVTHVRGSAYSRRMDFVLNKISTKENYFKSLSKRYS